MTENEPSCPECDNPYLSGEEPGEPCAECGQYFANEALMQEDAERHLYGDPFEQESGGPDEFLLDDEE